MFVSPFSLVSIYSTVRSHGIIGSACSTLAGAVGNLQYVMICVALGGATCQGTAVAGGWRRIPLTVAVLYSRGIVACDSL